MGTEENKTTKNLRYEIDWQYSPADFFPLPISERILDCDVTIESGTALARIEPQIYEQTFSLHNQLQRLIDARFKVQQFRTANKYELDDGSLTEYHHDGRRIRHLSATVSCKFSMSADVTITDASGKTIFDSSAERARERLQDEQDKIALQQLDGQLAVAIGEYYSKTKPPEPGIVSSLLSSYLASCNDPDNELVYLYELRDALGKRFGGESPTRQALGVSKAEWSNFGRLSNDEPVSQGRHRGKFSGEMRSATEPELVEARSFAKGLLLKFLLYLK